MQSSFCICSWLSFDAPLQHALEVSSKKSNRLQCGSLGHLYLLALTISSVRTYRSTEVRPIFTPHPVSSRPWSPSMRPKVRDRASLSGSVPEMGLLVRVIGVVTIMLSCHSACCSGVGFICQRQSRPLLSPTLSALLD